uniref:Zinc finger BED domain-containing protein RICESLEEPER 2-like n=1 Tax=Cicer arietinum TaxID=3827 RepID=A0A3Q7YBK4_CICAR|nr:zinc finger BED domain-containing protein RICESLEEPER 2-like [Cicer arietinum]XP_027186641.1 zinc finger BED domain-containing protein RICESLEEPER 2-like [Cicer arietinum]
MDQPSQNVPTQNINNYEYGTVATITNVAGPLLDNTQETKKRKPNASGLRQSSNCWEHFNRVPDCDVNTATCKHRHNRYLCDFKSHGTTNMNKHVNKCLKKPLLVLSDPNQTILIFPSVEGSGLVPTSSRFNLQTCRRAVSVFVVLDEQPFKAIEGEGFKYLCKTLQPQFTIPSRRTIARDCFQLYLDEKLKLKAFFKSDCNRVALTIDCWTSIQNLNYLTLTSHFVDNEWNYQKRIISFTIIPNHKGVTVGKKIEEVLKDWRIQNVSSITVDNASSNDVVVTLLKKKVKNMNGLMGDGEFFHMRCCAHILNLVVNDGLTEKHLSISTIRNVVRFVKPSPHRAAKFKECIEIARISCKKLVSLDVSTQWNSTYLMLEAAEKFQVAFEKLEEEDSSYKDFFGDAGPPSSFDWDIAQAFASFLKLFYEATRVFSISQHVSIHTTFHQMSAIYCGLDFASLNLNTVFANVGVDMMEKYEKYWGNVKK